ncbi:hypothetical protein NIB75_18980 [Bacteroides uniformis]|nr:hypothetical protein [Bacteroides uniformis]
MPLEGTKQVIAFGEAVGKLVQAKASPTPAVTNIKNMMDEIDRVFRTKNGKKRNFDYRPDHRYEKKRREAGTYQGVTHGYFHAFQRHQPRPSMPVGALDSKKIKANAKSLYEKKGCRDAQSGDRKECRLVRWHDGRRAETHYQSHRENQLRPGFHGT